LSSAIDMPISPREVVLAMAIGLMIVCGLASVAFAGRVSERTHVALAMLVILIGGFSLLVLFGSFLYASSVGAVALIVGLIALFKLMNRFEAQRRSKRGPGEN
jgi:hypothetical protein